jgi:hypothetical protein
VIALVLVALTAGAVTPEQRAEAAKEEDQAFKDVDGKQWCSAMRHFLKADELAPSADLVMNAAMAAEYANDLAFAKELYARVASAKGARTGEAKKKSAAVATRIEKEGPGNACPAEVVAAAPEPEPPPAPEPPPPAPAPEPPPAGPAVWPLALAGVGGAVAVASVAVLVVGVLPWFSHASAGDQLRALEKDKSTDASALRDLQRQQRSARDAWDGYGKALTVAGAAGAALGVVVAGAGVALFFALPSE